LPSIIDNYKLGDFTNGDRIFEFVVYPKNIDVIKTFVYSISIEYNIDKKNIIKDFLNYIIRNKPHVISRDCLRFVENIMHYQDCKNSYYINYSLARLSSFVSKDS
jgi:hypothetical protein